MEDRDECPDCGEGELRYQGFDLYVGRQWECTNPECGAEVVDDDTPSFIN